MKTDYDYNEEAQIFSVLASDTRIKLLHLLRTKALNCCDPETCDLSDRCCNVGELAKELGVAMSTTSFHIKELRQAGLIQTQRRGQQVYCTLNKALLEQLAQFFKSYVLGD